MKISKQLPIPDYAKHAARKALILRKKLPKSRRFGLSPSQAQSLGIISGVNQAKFILNNRAMPLHKAREFNRFYQRFKNCRTRKCEGAMNLWGGRKFLKFRVMKFVKAARKKR